MRLHRSVQYAAASLFLLCCSATPAEVPDDLGVKVTHPVECVRKTEAGDVIAVHYNGTLQDGGLEFDSSYNRAEPISFQLGRGQVIAGWDYGLLDMCIGEERELIIPPRLAYGDRRIGKIPAGSTLVFQTKLMGIQGVAMHEEDEEAAGPTPTPAATPVPSAKPSPSNQPPPHDHHTFAPAKTAYATDYGSGPQPSTAKEETAQTQTPIKPITPNPNPGEEAPDEGECRLLGPFALLVQAGLGVLALLALVWKRFRERPRRPVKVWFFDVSKQVVGSVLLHVLNLLMSMLGSADFALAHKAKQIHADLVDDDGRRINPCSFYLINIAIDTTIGIPILIILLRLLHYGFSLTPLARPKESIKTGHYGYPPRATWWLKQALIYFIGLVLMKLCVFFIFQVLPWIAWVGDWALRWTEGNEAIQIAFVMFVFPLIMNALQYYIIDSFIKERGAGDYQQPRLDEDERDGGIYHSVGEDDSDRDSMDSEERDKSLAVAASEVAESEGMTGGKGR